MVRPLLLAVIAVSTFSSGCIETGEPEIAQALPSVQELQEIPDKEVDAALVKYDRKTSLWTHEGELFSGYVVSYHPNQVLKEKIGVLRGKKENQSTSWFADGHLQQVSHYHEGRLHGAKKRWSEDGNHILLSHLNYHNGKAHGEQKKWYPTGELHKKLNLRMGKEEGLQQGFRKNGALYANYEAKNGRIFGLKKGTLCYGLEDENVQKPKN